MGTKMGRAAVLLVILDAGGDGVMIPHIRNLAEAREAIGFFRDAKASV
jgi:2-keto-3-deoxy-L-rhamnonate aldolase RhmA